MEFARKFSDSGKTKQKNTHPKNFLLIKLKQPNSYTLVTKMTPIYDNAIRIVSTLSSLLEIYRGFWNNILSGWILFSFNWSYALPVYCFAVLWMTKSPIEFYFHGLPRWTRSRQVEAVSNRDPAFCSQRRGYVQ